MYLKKISRSVFICFTSILMLISCIEKLYAADTSITFTVIKNNQEEQSVTAKMELNNLPNAGQWELAFDSIHPVLSLTADNSNVTQKQQTGDYYIYAFTVPEGNQNMNFDFSGKWQIKKNGDAPTGFFLINPQTKQIIPVNSKVILPDELKQAWSPEKEYATNIQKNNTSIEGNSIETSLTPETSLVVPIPVKLQRNPGEFTLTRQTQIKIADNNAMKAATIFLKKINTKSAQLINQPQSNTILLTSEGATNQLQGNQKEEGYILEVTPNLITLRAVTAAGFFYGLQTLTQLLPPEIYSDQLIQPKMGWKIPCVNIIDYPRFSYRGLHLDSARHFIPKDQVKHLLDLMAMHKLNYFEWHLTDDEGWRIEIKQYPELTQIGSKRGYQLPVTPAFGSGAAPYGGYYSQNDIREIVKYAADRYITIVPEIDMPGHARAMIVSLANQLKDPQDQSIYTSVQGYHDNILSPCLDNTYVVINNIIKEVSALFPGKYIHIGGDEVPNGVWEKAAACTKLGFNPTDPQFKNDMQNYFLTKIQEIIMNNGKIMAGWEEIAGDNGTLKAPLRVYVWNTGKIKQVYSKAKNMGYEVIMAPAENLYFDLAYNADPDEPGQYWAGYVDTFSAYAYSPIAHDQSEKIIKGIQGQLWSEMIASRDRLDYLAFPKMVALAETAWSPAERRNWQNFSVRMGKLHLPRLDHYGVNYRLSPPGVNTTSGWLNINVEFPGLTIRYTQDGTKPTVNSPEYISPIKTSSSQIKAASFSVMGRN